MQRLNTENAQHEVDGALYDRFAVTIFQYLCQQVSNKQDAEDLQQEVFVVVIAIIKRRVRGDSSSSSVVRILAQALTLVLGPC